jgi:hypothetical protein
VKAEREFRPKPWQWPNILSLDAPLVAVLWQLLLTQSLGIHVNRMEPLVLAVTVWFLYIADQVLDALRAETGGWQPVRKVFYRRYFRAAATAGGILAAGILPLAYFLLRPSTFHGGLELAVAVAIYFAAIHAAPPGWRGLWPREAAVALLFALGTFMPVWFAAGRRTGPLAAPTLLFALLCWANCAAIETWEWQHAGRQAGLGPSSATSWTGRHVGSTGITIALLAVCASVAGLATADFALACVVSGAALSLLALCRSRLPADAVSIAANLALCSPLFVLVLNWAIQTARAKP